MSYHTSKGRVYRTDSGGTYECNNGDPRCDDPDAPDAEDLEQKRADWILSDREG
jgi:hypothetical protein